MEREAFETLAMTELDAVFRYARFLTQSQEASEELVQEVYTRAFRETSIRAFETCGGGMRSWLITVARNEFYGRLERQRTEQRALRRVEAACDECEALDAAEVDGVDLESMSKLATLAVGSVSPELREVLWFWAVERMKYREIARALEIPIGTVMSRLHRARTQAARAIRAHLERVRAPACAPTAGARLHPQGERS